MVEFKTLEELYNRVLPALKLKANDKYDERYIFNYLSEKKWKKAKDLRLFQVIDDIIKLDTKEMRLEDETK